MINVNIEKNANESGSSVLRRFTKRVQEWGGLNRVRSIRYAERTKSDYVKKKNTLKVLNRRADNDLQIKLGKKAPGRPGRK